VCVSTGSSRLSALARANNVQPYAKINIGDRLTIPGGARASIRHAPAPQVAQPRTVPVQKVASAPTQHARVAKPDVHETESVTRSAEPAGVIPSFRWPVKGRIIAAFGARPNGTQNDGINLAVPEGTPVKAAGDGVVAYAGNELKGYGNLVLIRHAGGYVSAYANASNLTVKRGDSVKRGQVIAHAGQTGNVNSPQRIRDVAAAGADLFTIGTAALDGSFAPRFGLLSNQLRLILDACRGDQRQRTA